jgi:hypothetical protein
VSWVGGTPGGVPGESEEHRQLLAAKKGCVRIRSISINTAAVHKACFCMSRAFLLRELVSAGAQRISFCSADVARGSHHAAAAVSCVDADADGSITAGDGTGHCIGLTVTSTLPLQAQATH